MQRDALCFYPNRAANVTVVTDDDSPGRVLWAAKQWLTNDKHIRLNLFYPDRIEKYISNANRKACFLMRRSFVPLAGPKSQVQSPRSSEAHLGTWDMGLGTIANPYGIVPVFHFANNADLGMTGRSELEAAMPVQDGLNKSVLDMLVAMEFSAYRQRWAAGIEIEIDARGQGGGAL